MAQKTGFTVILRAGPYACAEHEFGGLPWWLLSNGPNSVTPRSNDPTYMAAVQRWYEEFLPLVVPYLYKNGGKLNFNHMLKLLLWFI
jgi:beta-galactosidase GanA